MTNETHHVIIGAGPAATNAAETIRQFEEQPSRITLVADEPAHSRMALPYWLANQIPRSQTLTADDAFFQRLAIHPMTGVRADRIDVANRSVILSDQRTLPFDKLLIATGSKPVPPPINGIDLPGVQPMWSLAHVQSALDRLTPIPKPRVVLVGAGFVGMIVLNAMFKRGWQLTVVEQQNQILPTMLDAESAKIIQAWVTQQGIAVHTRQSVQTITDAAGNPCVRLNDDRTIKADLVVLATGVRPNLQLVHGTSIQTDAGILVDQHMQTNAADIFAAGDVAQGPVMLSSQRAVHAIQPTAVDHGRIAGANMAGLTVSYPGSLSMNVLEVCGLQSASYGRFADVDAETVVITDPHRSVYRKLLWQDDRLVGAILTGQATDMGMLTDMGMIKGMIQTQTPMGIWKAYLHENAFDVRRAYIAMNIGGQLASTTLLGRPSTARSYRFQDTMLPTKPSSEHTVLFQTRNMT